MLAAALEACHRYSADDRLEVIVIDQGSTDDTPDLLRKLVEKTPNLSWRSAEGASVAHARNIGVESAKYNVVLFLDDDLAPSEDDFFRIHASLHAASPEENFVVLGKEIWTLGASFSLELDLAHMAGQGEGGFGYTPLMAYSFLDYRFFHTANLSMKKRASQDWARNGFQGFMAAALGDVEFGYRLSAEPRGLRLFYDPGAVACHLQAFTFAGLMSAQTAAGESLVHLARLHPATARDFGLQPFLDILANPNHDRSERLNGDYNLVIEGIKAWAQTMPLASPLGSESWHHDLIVAVFALCRLQGFLSAWPDKSKSAAVKCIVVDRFLWRMRQMLHQDAAQRIPGRPLALSPSAPHASAQKAG